MRSVDGVVAVTVGARHSVAAITVHRAKLTVLRARRHAAVVHDAAIGLARSARSVDARHADAAVGRVRAWLVARLARLRRARVRARVGRSAVRIEFRVRNARLAAAVRARRAVVVDDAAVDARSAAARNADVVLMTRVLRLAVTRAAIARRVARRRLQLAHVTVRFAAHRVSADADGIRRVDLARHRFVRSAEDAERAAAVGVLRAEIADDVTTAHGLADHDFRRSPRSACAAAARAAARRNAAVGAAVDDATADDTIDETAVRGTLRRIGRADSELLVHRLHAVAGAAIGVARADVTGLSAERRRRARSVRTELRTALGVLHALVAERLALVVQRNAFARDAALAAAIVVALARLVVGRAIRERADVVVAKSATAVARIRAAAPELETLTTVAERVHRVPVVARIRERIVTIAYGAIRVATIFVSAVVAAASGERRGHDQRDARRDARVEQTLSEFHVAAPLQKNPRVQCA